MSPTIAECLEHARQCEWYAARTNDEEDRKFLLRRAKHWTKLAAWKFGPLRGLLLKSLGSSSPKGTRCDPAMPARATVFRWLASNQEFRRSYALARECQAEDFAYEILEIADDSSRDYVKKTGADGKVTWVFDVMDGARSRQRSAIG